jgi:hexosaminidase
MLVPQPNQLETSADDYVLPSSARIFAPDAREVADLLRELLAPATGFALADSPTAGQDVIELILDRSIGEPGSEGYRLVVNDSGITAAAADPIGLRWAVQALRQLMPPQVYSPDLQPDVAWTVRGATAVDAPRFPWRGLMIDVGRWYKPIEWLYRMVDLVALHRMNVVHLHLTEDQGWRFEVHKYPKLTSVGAFRRESPLGHQADGIRDGTPHGGFYTQQELRDLVAFAARRGVTVVPEIDLPGHTQAAIAAYPELGNNPDQQLEVWTEFGVSSRVLNVADSTVEFMCDVLDELLDVFPSPFIHLGGDEVPEREWAASAQAKARIASLGLRVPSDLLGWWIGRLSEHLEVRGRRPVLWDELIGQNTPENAVIMAWRGQDRVGEALAAGHDVVATPHTSMYLNYPASDRPGEPLSIRDGSSPDGFDVLSLDHVHGYEPQPESELGQQVKGQQAEGQRAESQPEAELGQQAKRQQAKGQQSEGPARVIGVQANLWAEYAPTPSRAEYDLMPRLAAVAEVGWGGGTRDSDDLRHRLIRHLQRMDAAGISYRPLD